MNNVLNKILVAGAAIFCLAPAANAQSQDFINYYLSPQSQIDSMNMTNYYATAAANAWLQHCQQLRAQGYTGEIYCPLANTQTLVNSNRELQNTYNNYNQGYWNNQASYSNSMNNWSNYTLDQQQMVSPGGYNYWVQPSAGNYHWVNPNTGQVYSTNNGYAPDNYNYYQQLQRPNW